MDKYLQETNYIDYNNLIISEIIDSLDLKSDDKLNQAKKIFYHVRDSTKYSVKIISFSPQVFKASYSLSQEYSFCVPKALALCALSRAVGIPSRIHLVDFINHRLSQKLTELWGTNMMVGHCYSELYLDGQWIKATPALDIETCTRHGFIPVEFDGINDGLLKSIDNKGNLHAEYVKDHGVYADLPYEFLMNLFENAYGKMDENGIVNLFTNQTPTFDSN